MILNISATLLIFLQYQFYFSALFRIFLFPILSLWELNLNHIDPIPCEIDLGGVLTIFYKVVHALVTSKTCTTRFCTSSIHPLYSVDHRIIVLTSRTDSSRVTVYLLPSINPQINICPCSIHSLCLNTYPLCASSPQTVVRLLSTVVLGLTPVPRASFKLYG